MLVDLEHDRLLSFREAAAMLPSGGVNLSTLHRWRQKGVRGHVLQTVMVGGRRYIPLRSLEDFVAALSGGPVVTAERSRDRERRVARARAELRARGV
jgi:hypothetical protein